MSTPMSRRMLRTATMRSPRPMLKITPSANAFLKVLYPTIRSPKFESLHQAYRELSRHRQQPANCSQWRCRNDRLEPDVRRFRCAGLKEGAHRGGAGLSVDSDHHVGGFDNRIRFGTGLKSQFFRGLFGDDRHHLDAGPTRPRLRYRPLLSFARCERGLRRNRWRRPQGRHPRFCDPPGVGVAGVPARLGNHLVFTLHESAWIGLRKDMAKLNIMRKQPE